MPYMKVVCHCVFKYLGMMLVLFVVELQILLVAKIFFGKIFFGKNVGESNIMVTTYCIFQLSFFYIFARYAILQ